MAVLAVGLVIGGNNGTRAPVDIDKENQGRVGSNQVLVGMSLWGEEGQLDEALSYLAFAYSLGLGPTGKEEVPYSSGLTLQDQGVPPGDRSKSYTISTPSPMGLGQEDIQDLACRPEFTWPCKWVLLLILCESGGRSKVVGSEVINGIRYFFYGLLQVYHPDKPRGSNAYLLQPYLNLLEGHEQYIEWQRGIRTSSPWPNCP